MLYIVKKRDMRTAFTIVELMAAIMVLALCLAAFVKMTHTARQQRNDGRTHQTAADQLQNVLEQLVDADPEQLAAGGFDLTPYEAIIARALPGGTLQIVCEPLADETAVLQTWRIDAKVTWPSGQNRPPRSTTLTRLFSKPLPATVADATPEGGVE